MFRSKVKTTLYLGLHAPRPVENQNLIHLPLIRIAPRCFSDPVVRSFYQYLPCYSHLIFTSQSAVKIFADYLPFFCQQALNLSFIQMIAVGAATKVALENRGFTVAMKADDETAEGLCQLIAPFVTGTHFFGWPHSALSRSIITDFFRLQPCRFLEAIFYDTHFVRPLDVPSLETIDEIVFTSSSTVEAFLQVYGKIPWEKKLRCKGPITQKRLFLLRD